MCPFLVHREHFPCQHLSLSMIISLFCLPHHHTPPSCFCCCKTNNSSVFCVLCTCQTLPSSNLSLSIVWKPHLCFWIQYNWHFRFWRWKICILPWRNVRVHRLCTWCLSGSQKTESSNDRDNISRWVSDELITRGDSRVSTVHSGVSMVSHFFRNWIKTRPQYSLKNVYDQNKKHLV
jgi:hypothetical protein